MSTRWSMSKSIRRNGQCPSTYCTGSPANLRPTIACKDTPMRIVAGSFSDSRNSLPSSPLASSQIQRASFSSPRSDVVSFHNSRHVLACSLLMGHTQAWVYFSPANCRERSSLIRACDTSSKLPLKMSCNLYKVSPMRWSVRRLSL